MLKHAYGSRGEWGACLGTLRTVHVRTLKGILREMSYFIIVNSLCKLKKKSKFYLIFVCFSIVCWPNSLPLVLFTSCFAGHEEFNLVLLVVLLLLCGAFSRLLLYVCSAASERQCGIMHRA